MTYPYDLEVDPVHIDGHHEVEVARIVATSATSLEIIDIVDRTIEIELHRAGEGSRVWAMLVRHEPDGGEPELVANGHTFVARAEGSEKWDAIRIALELVRPQIQRSLDLVDLYQSTSAVTEWLSSLEGRAAIKAGQVSLGVARELTGDCLTLTVHLRRRLEDVFERGLRRDLDID